MLPGRKFTPEDVVRILVQRRWIILLPFAVGLALAPLIAARVPELYRSETLIMVVPQRIPDSYVKSTVTARIEDRLPSISDQIMSRSRLERIIADFDLYRKERATGIMEDVVRQMRSDITVAIEGQGKESFRVSYVSQDPQVAQRVTERLASLYIEENLRDRENLADGTNQFLEAQLQDAKRRLIEHEKKLEAYRQRYAGQLPSQLQSNLQGLQAAQLQLQAAGESMNRARERRLLIERQLTDAQAVPQLVAVVGSGSASQDAPVLTSAQQLEAARTRLEAMRLRYTPDHPDVRTLERIIGELEIKADEEAKRPAAPDEKPMTPAEIARQKRIRDLQAELDVIDHQLTAAQAEERRLKSTIAEYQAKIDAVPARESELVELTRDYSTLQEAYSSLLTKREESKLAADLERRQIGEQFRILDAASLPERPHNQRERLAFTAAGAVAGLLLGLALVGWFEYRDSSFRREEDMLRLLNLPVLAIVPVMASTQEQRRQRLRAVLLDIGGGLILAGSVAVIVIWKLQA